MKYTITKIKSEPRNFLMAINNGLNPNVNEITIHLEKEYLLFTLIPMKSKKVAEGVVSNNVDINNYIKVGETFDINKYPMLKIK
jgi:hypothetical protein